ncbi:hexosaminidase [Paragonimus westermani]|uniref:beta-N-acetylhexosaminidase n=1 Tax=Paragonimus westermani TaxID=34504 RepID=A0A5J4NNQ7_9TREM|nr:hexosaminidase [Paragonimus westermani]
MSLKVARSKPVKNVVWAAADASTKPHKSTIQKQLLIGLHLGGVTSVRPMWSVVRCWFVVQSQLHSGEVIINFLRTLFVSRLLLPDTLHFPHFLDSCCPAPPVGPHDPKFLPNTPLKPQENVAGTKWDRKKVAPVDRFSLGDQWKFESIAGLLVPVLHAPQPTFGMVFPLPFWWTATQEIFPVNTRALDFRVTSGLNYILKSAVERYKRLISTQTGLSAYAAHWSHQQSVLPRTGHPSVNTAGTAGTTPEFAEKASAVWSDASTKWIYDKFDSQPMPFSGRPIHQVLVHVKSLTGSDWPSSEMDESYDLLVDSGAIYLIANETWGALRGLETLSQLIWRTSDKTQVYINRTHISDRPRFTHRGLLVDTSRHYISKSVLFTNLVGFRIHRLIICQTVSVNLVNWFSPLLSLTAVFSFSVPNQEAMAYNKLNVFHWHIVDDNSYPYQSQLFPNLSKKGAYNERQVYTPQDIKEVVEFARLRGIRVIPEFDIPVFFHPLTKYFAGHTRSLAYGKPEILSQCRSSGEPTIHFGPLNPFSSESYRFLSQLLAEFADLFPDEYIHLGGDEVESVCWDSDPEVIRAREKLQLSSTQIHEYFWRRYVNIGVLGISFCFIFTGLHLSTHVFLYDFSVSNLVTDIGNQHPEKRRKVILWEDVLQHVNELPKSLVTHIWQPHSGIDMVHTDAVVYSSCWYLDNLFDIRRWASYYLCDPVESELSTCLTGCFLKLALSLTKNPRSVLGGEACMWSEYQSDDTIIQKIWPVTSAIAERLWSPHFVNSLERVGPRIEEQRCRMISRGIPQSVLQGPGSCELPGAVSSFFDNVLLSEVLQRRGNIVPDTDHPIIFTVTLLLCFTAGVLVGAAAVFHVFRPQLSTQLRNVRVVFPSLPRRSVCIRLLCLSVAVLFLLHLFRTPI